MTRKTILLIDDERIDRLHIADLIASDQRDWTVQMAATAAEGLALFRAAVPDCVLLDNRLGLEDGLTLLPRIKALDRYCPVVFLTGQGSEAVAVEAIKRGASDYLVKTALSSVALVTTITNAIERARLEHSLDRQQTENQRQQHKVRELERTIGELKTMSSAGSTTSVTRAISGTGAIRARSPEIFTRMAQTYEGLMDDYLHQLVVDAPKPFRQMKAIVQELGHRGGGPRDLLDIHVAALEAAAAGANPARAEAYSVQGRLIALEMMGLLVDYYRTGRGVRPDEED
jgi:FixJ family two-component response regulator